MSKDPVLLVDDDPDDVELALRAFREVRFPYRVDVARDGEEALAYLAACNPRIKDAKMPAMIVLDLKMPKVDGIEVLRRLRADQWLKYLVVLVLTTSKEERDRAEALHLGANLYMQKPADFTGYLRMAHTLKGLLAHAK